ncbi:MAG: class I SAM-dependent methyltransferase [Synergistaceae bacterium]|jgi:2-polyprenyl-3-methyl-5-hydroxy-6-metoxy-1,4-benzoquinol methylase|nr:class I SAM-dependent methyltransferase [Synergistaceae bacterium]
MKDANMMKCAVCGGVMPKDEASYYSCASCGYMASDMRASAGSESADALESVRVANFGDICGVLKSRYSPPLKSVLDIGCAGGLFLKFAAGEGFDCFGLEPEPAKASLARERGCVVGTGFFPDAEWLGGKKFDVIIFNDSFEHIPNLAGVINGIKRHLNENGVAVINLPSSGGIIFAVASLLSKFGVWGPLHRLWQRGIVSPHLHYFNPKNLEILFARNGFKMDLVLRLKYYSLDRLWTRCRYHSSIFASVISFLGLLLLYPFSRWKSDVFAAFFRRDMKN